MKIIAHRGFSADYPENTLLAFNKALETGADGIETDLRLSRDGKAVIFHDDNLKRITGIDNVPEALTLSELKALDAGEGERIPSLDELIALADARATLILEVKYNPATYKRLCEVIEETIKEKSDWIELSCFDDPVLEYMHILNPQIRLHKLIEDAKILEDRDLERRYHYASYFDIDVKLRKRVLKLGLLNRHKIIFWTVSDQDITQEKEAGLYGIMKNNPQR